MAQHPATNVANLNMLRSTSPVFQPAINVASPPSDWTIAIIYSGGGLASPQGVATDQSGNIWVANAGGAGSVSEFNSAGTPLSWGSGLHCGRR